MLLRRAFLTLSNEPGHTFGLKHCVFFSCLMQGANSLEEAQSRMPDLCPVCLRKLLWCAGSESGAALRAVCEQLRSAEKGGGDHSGRDPAQPGLLDFCYSRISVVY